jgi:FixJ family two-component response regulator
MAEFGVPKKPLIAIVDDVESVRAALQGLVRSLGLANVAFASGESFLNSPHLRRATCVIADVNMPGMTGPELHRRLVAQGSAIPVILITAYPDDSVREQELRAGVVGYLSKPFDEADLIACLRLALARPGLHEQG